MHVSHFTKTEMSLTGESGYNDKTFSSDRSMQVQYTAGSGMKPGCSPGKRSHQSSLVKHWFTGTETAAILSSNDIFLLALVHRFTEWELISASVSGQCHLLQRYGQNVIAEGFPNFEPVALRTVRLHKLHT